MSFFGKILSSLGLGDDKSAPPSGTVNPHSTPPPSATPSANNGLDDLLNKAAAENRADPSLQKPPSSSSASTSTLSSIDVAAKLESLAKSSNPSLNWRTSIVDLLKLLGLDSSLEARKELAAELHCPNEMLNDSAQMNTWLHRAVMKKLAENGGQVPSELR